MSPPPRYFLVEAVNTRLSDVTGCLAFDDVVTATVPPSGGAGWIVTHSIAGGGFLDTLADPNAHGRYTLQFDCMSTNRAQAELLRDRVNNALLDRTGSAYTNAITAPTGFVVSDRLLLNPGPTDRTGLGDNFLFAAVSRVIFLVTKT